MPKYYLVGDDIERVADGFEYRVRIWRAPGNSVVVVEPVAGSPPPDLYTTTLANRVARAQLGFAVSGKNLMAWYERCRFEGEDRCYFVSFRRVGRCRHRPMLMSPSYRRVAWAKVEEVLFATEDAHESDAMEIEL